MLNINAIENLNVFISYSRPDQIFADELVAGLEFAGAAVSIDRHSIREGEDWKARLSGLIASADTVVFVLSPDSARSSICAWEVAEASTLGKRILPVLVRPLDGATPPARLVDLNYVRFDEGRSFMTGLKALVTALATNLDWLRDHTQLLSRAMDWERGGRTDNRLMSGKDIIEAKALVANRPRNAPEITALQLDFIRESEAAEIARNDAMRDQLEERSRLLKDAEAAAVQRAEALSRAETALKVSAKLRRRQDVGGALTIVILSAIGLWAYGVIAERRVVAREAAREDIRGQIVSYATSAGQTDEEGAGYQASCYATAVSKQLDRRNKSVVEALVDAHKEVNQLSKSRQRPILSTSLNGFLYLARQPATRRKRAILVSVDGSGGSPQVSRKQDVDAIASALTDAGFTASEIDRLYNPGRANIEAEIDKAGRELASDSKPPANTLLLFFFSGEGVEMDGMDYLIPQTDHATGRSPAEVARDTIEVTEITSKFDELAAASVVILDTHFPSVNNAPSH